MTSIPELSTQQHLSLAIRELADLRQLLSSLLDPDEAFSPAVRSHGKVPAGGQVAVPTDGQQLCLPTARVLSSRR